MIRANFKQRRNIIPICFCSVFSKSKKIDFEVKTLRYILKDIWHIKTQMTYYQFDTSNVIYKLRKIIKKESSRFVIIQISGWYQMLQTKRHIYFINMSYHFLIITFILPLSFPE